MFGFRKTLIGVCAEGSPHAQGGQSGTPVPTKENELHAGRSARDEIQVLLYALRGEKSPIGGICNPSVAPHLHRKSLREVRSEFSWTVAFASEAVQRHVGTLLFWNFFLLCKEKSALSLLQREVVRTVP